MIYKILATTILETGILMSCVNGPSITLRGNVSGSTITEQDVERVKEVSESKKQEIEAITNKGVTGNLFVYSNTVDVYPNNTSERTIMNFLIDIKLDLEKDHMIFDTIAGGFNYADVVKHNPGVNANGAITGKSEAQKDNLKRHNYADYITLHYENHLQRISPFLFGENDKTCAAYCDELKSSLYSWSYGFDLNMFNVEELNIDMRAVFKYLNYSGDLANGNYEVGISTPLSLYNEDAFVTITKLRVSYSSYLLKEMVLRYESKNTTEKYTTYNVGEVGYIFNYQY